MIPASDPRVPSVPLQHTSIIARALVVLGLVLSLGVPALLVWHAVDVVIVSLGNPQLYSGFPWLALFYSVISLIGLPVALAAFLLDVFVWDYTRGPWRRLLKIALIAAIASLIYFALGLAAILVVQAASHS